MASGSIPIDPIPSTGGASASGPDRTRGPLLPVTLPGILAHLPGLGAWLCVAANFPHPHRFSEGELRRRVPAMLRQFERDIKLTIEPKLVSTRPPSAQTGPYPAAPSPGGGAAPGSGTEVQKVFEDPYDFYPDPTNYLNVRLGHRPVREIRSLGIWVRDQLLLDIPASWLEVKWRTGDVSAVPTSSAQLIARSANALAILGFSSYDYVPGGIHAEYVAGLPALWWVDKQASGWSEVLDGTVTVGAGSKIVTGSGTAFHSDVNVGEWLYGPSTYGGGYGWLGQVASIESNISLTLEGGAPAALVAGVISAGEAGINPEWADLHLNLERFCALEVLNTIAYVADPGLKQVTISGGVGGENYYYDRFTERKQELQFQVDSFLEELKQDEASSPLLLGVI